MESTPLSQVPWRIHALLILTLLPLWWDGSFQTLPATGAMHTSLSSILTDTEALVEFKQAINDSQGILSGWIAGASGSVCGWHGVICNSSRVIELHLTEALLSGLLPETALSKLDHLQVLSLQRNSFYGNFTGAFLMGSSLNCSVQFVDLSSNNLGGSISSRVLSSCSSLSHLNLSFNRFTHLLPADRSSRISLQVLDLSYNQLSGKLNPELFAECGSLQMLNLSYNQLNSAEIGSCPTLQHLILSSNKLSGELPSSLGSLTSLKSLYFSNNSLSGVIPPELTETCGTLQELDLSTNNLSGSLPVSFSACKYLVNFCLSTNLFSGQFPNILGQMQTLKIMRIDENFFEGPILAYIDNCSSLEILDLSSNNFSGEVPLQGICNVKSSLKMLLFPNNNFTGPMPASLANCTKLQHLDVSFNSLTGNLPPELSTLLDLQHLMVWNNKLDGPIPAEFGNSQNLKTLITSYNNLNGSIPFQLSNCSQLSWLSLASNQFSGSIPPEIGRLTKLTILELSGNSLSGHIPLELANCTSLAWLDLNNNQLNGVIPPTIGRKATAPLLVGTITNRIIVYAKNLNDQCRGAGGLLEFEGIRWNQLSQSPMLAPCKSRFYKGINYNVTGNVSSLIFLDLSYNNLVGTLPGDFGSMKDLIILDVGHNQLNGSIPSSLGLLKELEVLHLAHNQLEGNIPNSFSKLTFLSDFNVSNNKLSGPIPPGGQLTTFPTSVYAMNNGLCDLPLKLCQPNNLPHTPNLPHISENKYASRNNKIISAFTFAIASLICIFFWCVWHKMKTNKKATESVYPFDKNWTMSYQEPLSINVATFERPLKKLTFLDLLEATKGFDVKNVVGSGGFGEVYKAHFKDGSVLAVKKLTRFSYQGERQFLSEMETLGKINHPNLVPLLGYCKIGEERILVYEYMPCGNLEQLLHEQHIDRERIKIPWHLRKQIILDLARGLTFLHHKCIPHVIHRDMKSSNVLFNIRFEARLSDFGMARLISASDTHNSVSSLAGTPGYVPPEYYQSCKCTREGDVYSFGVVLLEILTRRRPTDKEEFGDNNLVGWVKLRVNESKGIDVLDPDLGGFDQEHEMLQYLSVACECLEDQPASRPSMLEVVDVFKELSLS